MSENLDSPVPDGLGPISELPTTGPTFQGRQIVADRYEILSRLGRGGMGEVWHAYDLKLRVDVALKSLRLDLKRSQDPVEALRREVRTAREVISPNVCRIFDLVVEEDQELISMEYIDGITLTAMLVKKGALELREARDIAAQFLAGLEAIHQAGLVHRDLKPENIMITRTGRVVVMDFGIAKQITQLGGTISGTLPYMSPEQLSGQKVDARSDVFSAGIVLAEMIHPQGVFGQKTREEIWNGVRKHPMQLPESPWKAVIARAVAEEPENRFPSAGALARALEEVTQRVETIEERKPYPGLSSFTAADAEYFFGRELEVETVIKKLQQLHLMALIGPSGAGKTSFLRAGLIPALPAGWSHVFCTPGDAPLVNLGQSLVPELSGDMEAMRKMVRLEDTDTALWLLHRWSENHPEAVLIVDRFEELFTLNNPQTQSRFAELLGRAALEADIRVLLTMRDDFLMLCHDHAALIPIFSELTGLSPLSGAALRRALVQPALRCNYRFEDESLVDEILADVEKERGALPLMAFAAARLWEKRDRQTGQLTREAYKEIGGVAGALAQHAEATMERIGVERLPIVREIFRNLITAQNTRAARDTDELLSVFPERSTAEEILRTLIDARLLTSFEAPQAEGEKPKRRVEIIHESLLTNWPRLVRWQTQDADSAQLRDQLRQAAQLWEQRSRSEDLLWTGAAFLEFQAWRQRYPGGLTTTEEAFANAMISRANKRRRQRRIAVVTMFVVLFGILIVISNFWRGEKSARQESDVARRQAVSEALRREAAQLLALGRLKMADYPTVSLAYAIASLERADTSEGRRFALEVLSQGPTAFVMPGNINTVTFSPDGKSLATGGLQVGISLWPRSGGNPKLLAGQDGSVPMVRFGPNSDLLAGGSKNIRFWSIPDGKELGRAESVNGPFLLTNSQLIGIRKRTEEGEIIDFQTWSIPDGKYQPLATWDAKQSFFDIDPSGQWLAYGHNQQVHLIRFDDLGSKRALVLGTHRGKVNWISFHSPNRLVSADQTGEIRLWRLFTSSGALERIIQSKPAKNRWYLDTDKAGSRLAASEHEAHSSTELAFVWDLMAPPDADPLLLRAEVPWLNSLSIHPDGQWLATGNTTFGMLWPLHHNYPHVLRDHAPPGIKVAFTPEGKQLVSCSDDGTIRLWPLAKSVAGKKRTIMENKNALLGMSLSVDPAGTNVLTASRFDRRVFLVPVTGTGPRLLPVAPMEDGFQFVGPVAFGRGGRLAAIAQAPPSQIRIWNLDSQQYLDLDTRLGEEDCEWGKQFAGWIFDMKFSHDGRLITAGTTGLRIWDVEKRRNKAIRPCKDKMATTFALSADGHRLLVADYDELEAQKPSHLSVVNLKENRFSEITSHGNRILAVALDSAGKIAVTGDSEGVVRVGPVSDKEPHLLFGHQQRVTSVAVSPDSKWIASGSDDGTIRVWPMPQGLPFHTLPYTRLLQRLRGMTNLRVIQDSKTDTGYRIETAPFPGWEKVPTW